MIAAAGFALAGGGQTRAVTAPWIVFCTDDFPPYCWNMPGKGPAGLDVELVSAMLERAGPPYDIQQMAWSRAMVGLEQGRCDILFGLVPSEQRFRDFLMVGPFRDGEIAFAVRADNPITFQTLDDLAGLTVGTTLRNHYGAAFDNATHFTRDPARTDQLSLLKLVAGRVDLVVGDRLALAWKAKQEGISDKIRFLATPLSVSPHYIALPRDRGEKAQRLEAARQSMVADGSLDAIIQRWRLTG
ncbi:transporter substrate-binding domain-containing protein [Niveispirillum sp. SYP-B3756]|uniref:substrate-binding periplasmic protein n=1 Tax=Niveispirillum sp. SYP-B3756 TaxID=2662178 RepID=UPI0015664E9D|nr:transporter substrate-binding domain-containing protein [Niveispirillum sp. SYP-B3756]